MKIETAAFRIVWLMQAIQTLLPSSMNFSVSTKVSRIRSGANGVTCIFNANYANRMFLMNHIERKGDNIRCGISCNDKNFNVVSPFKMFNLEGDDRLAVFDFMNKMVEIDNYNYSSNLNEFRSEFRSCLENLKENIDLNELEVKAAKMALEQAEQIEIVRHFVSAFPKACSNYEIAHTFFEVHRNFLYSGKRFEHFNNIALNEQLQNSRLKLLYPGNASYISNEVLSNMKIEEVKGLKKIDQEKLDAVRFVEFMHGARRKHFKNLEEIKYDLSLSN